MPPSYDCVHNSILRTVEPLHEGIAPNLAHPHSYKCTIVCCRNIYSTKKLTEQATLYLLRPVNGDDGPTRGRCLAMQLLFSLHGARLSSGIGNFDGETREHCCS